MDTIPTILDSVFEIDGESMARCLYFHIECDESLDPWILQPGNNEIPFLMIGLAGVITTSLDGGYFRHPNQLDALIAVIESVEGRNTESADIWMPTRFLRDGVPLTRGDVLRVGRKLFAEAFSFRQGGKSRFMETSSAEVAESSPEETKVFAAWSEEKYRSFGKWRNMEHPPFIQISDKSRGPELEGPGIA